MSFQEIAERLGLSTVRVERAYQSAMRKIRTYLLRKKKLRYELQEFLSDLTKERGSKNG